MTYVDPAQTGLGDLLTPTNCTLLLIDHQPFQFSSVQHHDPCLVMNDVIGLAKTASPFDVPTILSTQRHDRGSFLPAASSDVCPDRKPIDRTTINSGEDRRLLDAVATTGIELFADGGISQF